MLLGRAVSMPLAIAPVAFHRLFHPDGERATAQAAKTAGVPFIVSTLSSVPIEEITAIGGSVWFQLYWLREPGRTLDLARRAEDAGCEALVLTVDIPWMGRRLRDMRNQFTLPADVFAAHLEAAPSSAHRRALNTSALAIHAAQVFAPSVTWACVAALRESTRLPLMLKGVMAPEDASRAAEFGVDAIVVSNHGGRQLDGALPSIDALAKAVGAAGTGCEVLLDGGIRTGSDLLKAVALGASGVLVGRPLMWGLAVAGEAGALQVLDLLATEFGDALGLAGCDDVMAARQLHASIGRPGVRPSN
jgi:4-hydroxymandelate oxidase